jgi:hypothetical protein
VGKHVDAFGELLERRLRLLHGAPRECTTRGFGVASRP